MLFAILMLGQDQLQLHPVFLFGKIFFSFHPENNSFQIGSVARWHWNNPVFDSEPIGNQRALKTAMTLKKQKQKKGGPQLQWQSLVYMQIIAKLVKVYN